MSVAIDASVLIYSADAASPHHARADAALAAVFRSGESVWLFPPVITAFLRVSTHGRLFRNPLTLAEAFSSVRSLLALPSVQVAPPAEDYLDSLEQVASAAQATGKLIHDAEIVALMKQHGVDRILTADRDFLGFEGITVTLLNP